MPLHPTVTPFGLYHVRGQWSHMVGTDSPAVQGGASITLTQHNRWLDVLRPSGHLRAV